MKKNIAQISLLLILISPVTGFATTDKVDLLEKVWDSFDRFTKKGRALDRACDDADEMTLVQQKKVDGIVANDRIYSSSRALRVCSLDDLRQMHKSLEGAIKTFECMEKNHICSTHSPQCANYADASAMMTYCAQTIIAGERDEL